MCKILPALNWSPQPPFPKTQCSSTPPPPQPTLLTSEQGIIKHYLCYQFWRCSFEIVYVVLQKLMSLNNLFTMAKLFSFVYRVVLAIYWWWLDDFSINRCEGNLKATTSLESFFSFCNSLINNANIKYYFVRLKRNLHIVNKWLKASLHVRKCTICCKANPLFLLPFELEIWPDCNEAFNAEPRQGWGWTINYVLGEGGKGVSDPFLYNDSLWSKIIFFRS